MYKLTACLFFCMLLVQTKGTELGKQLKRYNINWTSQSKNSSESMPLGGGDIGCNVWVENGDILFYISRSGAFDENNQLLKLGRGRLRLEPNIFTDSESVFSQELKLHDGYIQIIGQNGKEKVTINLWVDVFKPHINVSLTSTSEVKLTAFYENWRTADRQLPMQERSACFSYSAYEGDVVTYRDSIRYHKDAVLWYHRNRSDKLLIDFCIKQQGLTAVKDQLTNPQKNLTFGGLMLGKGMIPAGTGSGKYVDTPFTYWSLTSEKPAKNHQVKFALHTDQTNTIEQWEEDLLSSNLSFNSSEKWARTKTWWHNYWERSYIFINADKNDPTDPAWQVGRNYQLFRYQLGCNAYGAYPTKFNGGLFTVDPLFVKQYNQPNHGTPDYRTWGGGSHTAQNQRLVYWPMLKSGDFDMMHSQFRFYSRSLKNTELRTKVYWGHEGCSFTEHPETFGLPAAGTWGFESGPRKRSDDLEHGTLTNKWVRLHYTNQLEFSFMILKYYQYSGKTIQEYIPFITSSLNFFFEHYKYRQMQQTGKPFDENDKLVIYPSTACETFKDVKNPTDISAALIAVIQAMQTLPDELLGSKEKDYWHSQLRHIPDMTYANHKGKKIIVAAQKLPERINSDIPEMYPVFPYGIYGVGLPGLAVAVDTWNSGLLNDRKNFISWHQDAIFCARMGLTEEAKKVSILKMQDCERRFPSFWGPGHDYVPDHNWGGSGMIGLQEMLLQTVDNNVYLLPAWPEEWDVAFRLHAPDKTIIDCKASHGKITKLKVSPRKRLKDIAESNN
ncbi:DUF5703 domain-containing protein [Sunxiuqinia rutila]|uniref:DUF5703 domain-containing protein n=1 Tax=Sunxiuqinia rutila TaxID=1397841 RepID=UPI003D35E0C2